MNRLIHSFKLSHEQALGLLKEISKICHDQKLLLGEGKLSMNTQMTRKQQEAVFSVFGERKAQMNPVSFKQYKELWAWSNQKDFLERGSLEQN